MAQQDASTLAEGHFGKVYKKWYKGQWACIKRLKGQDLRARDLMREYKVYRTSQHENVVRLLDDPWIEDSKWNIPLEFISGEELETTIFCPRKSEILLTPIVTATIIKGMCAGLSHLHSKDIVHQDIKPDNIMVEHGTNRAVIIDLGLAKFFKGGITSAQNLGNIAYSAPEILKNGVRDKRSDVWAMGKVIAELCIRPKHRLTTRDVKSRKIRQTLSETPYGGVVSEMVHRDPADRTCMLTVADKADEILMELKRTVCKKCLGTICKKWP